MREFVGHEIFPLQIKVKALDIWMEVQCYTFGHNKPRNANNKFALKKEYVGLS